MVNYEIERFKAEMRQCYIQRTQCEKLIEDLDSYFGQKNCRKMIKLMKEDYDRYKRLKDKIDTELHTLESWWAALPDNKKEPRDLSELLIKVI